MLTAAVSSDETALPSQYNNLRKDAFAGSFLLPHQQTSPGMTLYVENGVFYINQYGVNTRVIFAGGNSPTITAPSSHPRIDLLTIDPTGTLALVTGTENASPVVPTYPPNVIVIAEIYNVVGETAIYNNENMTGGQGYIYNDVRPSMFINSIVGYVSRNGNAVGPTTSGTQVITHSLGRTPAIIRINAILPTSTTIPCFSLGELASTIPTGIYFAATGAAGTTNDMIYLYYSSGQIATATISTLTSTQFTLTWTITGGSYTPAFSWVVE